MAPRDVSELTASSIFVGVLVFMISLSWNTFFTNAFDRMAMDAGVQDTWTETMWRFCYAISLTFLGLIIVPCFLRSKKRR